MDSDTNQAHIVNIQDETKKILSGLKKITEFYANNRYSRGPMNYGKAHRIMNPILSLIDNKLPTTTTTNDESMSGVVNDYIKVWLVHNCLTQLKDDYKYLNNIDKMDGSISVCQLVVGFMSKTDLIYSPTNIPLILIRHPHVKGIFPNATEDYWGEQCVLNKSELSQWVIEK